MTRKRPSWVSHMTLRQLILLAASVSAVLALIFVDGRSTVEPIGEVEETTQEVAMPSVSSADMLATSWFCPGVPGNDDGINSAIAIANPSDAAILQTDHAEYRELKSMQIPEIRTFLDGRGVTKESNWQGVQYHALGRAL